jgi:hypothetical protein
MSFIEHYDNPVQFSIIKNYYTSDEIKELRRNFELLRPRLLPPEFTGSATTNLVYQKKNKGTFIHMNSEPEVNIISMSRKLRVHLDDLKSVHWMYRYLGELEHFSTLLSLYDTGDEYKEHKDSACLTAIYYHWDEPKSFEGGDLYFGDFKVPIENNCLLIFPSCILHRVTPVTQGGNRFALTNFYDNGSALKSNILIKCEKVLSEKDYKYVSNFLHNGKWSFGHLSTGKGCRFWSMELSDQHVFNTILLKRIEQLTMKKFKLYRVYANGQTYGQNGSFHQDSPDDCDWTFILYINVPDGNELGGETEFINYITNEHILVKPVINSGVLFKSNIWHRGIAPSRLCDDIRITVAWKLKELHN